MRLAVAVLLVMSVAGAAFAQAHGLERALDRPQQDLTAQQAESQRRLDAQAQLISRLAGERIHRAEMLELYAVDRGLNSGLAARLV